MLNLPWNNSFSLFVEIAFPLLFPQRGGRAWLAEIALSLVAITI
jgi:hypothetical protein